MARKALLLDLDGTLWDSYRLYAKALQASTNKSSEWFLKRLRNGDNVIALARKSGVPNSRLSKHCRLLCRELKLYRGVTRTLLLLQRRKILLGVVTNLPRWLTEPLLEQLGLRDHFVYCLYDAKKPHSTRTKRAVRWFKRKRARQIVLVGDRASDAHAAQGAAIPFAWAAYGYDTQRPEYATVVLRSFRGVSKLWDKDMGG